MSGRPCDVCGAPNAPRGYQPPGHRPLRKGQRPLACCTDPACLGKAEARWKAAYGRSLRERAAEAEAGSLFDYGRARS